MATPSSTSSSSPSPAADTAPASKAGPAGAAGVGSLWQGLKSLARELPGLLGDRVELLALELQRAGRVLMQIVWALLAIAVLGLSAWMAIWLAVAWALLAAGLHGIWVLALVLLAHVLGLVFLRARLLALFPGLRLPATLRHLGVGAAELPGLQARSTEDAAP